MKCLKKYLSVFMTLVLILTGCADPAAGGQPALREPVSRSSVCSPVRKARVGQTEVFPAVVVPTEYAHFYKSDMALEKIRVEAGDFVKKGELLASADTRAAKKRKKELEEELAQEQKKFLLSEKITAGKQEEIELSGERKASKGQTEKTEIAVMKENARYEKQLYQQRIADLKTQIRAEEDKIREGALRARHSGYVTYRKSLSVSPEAGANENIIAVADRKEKYLEVTDLSTKQYPFSDYEVKYILSGGKTYPIKEIPHSRGELAVADRNKTYPPVRLSCPDGAGLSLGDSCLVYFKEKNMPEVLVVGNESLHTQGEDYYVYVRDDGGEQEKRIVTIGERDEHLTEIRSGLEEGEMVCYSTNAAMPVDYKTAVVERTDFEIRSRTGSCQFADVSSYVQLSDREGLIVKCVVSKGDKVKKGDPLYIVDTGTGKALQAELSYEIRKEKEAYQETLKGMRKQAASERKGKRGKIRAVIKRRWQYERQLAEYTYTCTMRQLQAQLREAREGNDGSGRVTVYAQHSGKIENCQIKVGQRISGGIPVLTIRRRDRKRLLIFSIPTASDGVQEGQKAYAQIRKRLANVGESIEFSLYGKRYTGVCTGYTVFAEDKSSEKIPNKVYLTTDKGKSYLGGNERSGYKYPGYYVEPEKEELLEKPLSTLIATYSSVKLRDVLTVPVKWIQKDDQQGKGEYYVWCLVKGELVKQYVTLDPGLNDGADQVIFSGLGPGDQIVGS